MATEADIQRARRALKAVESGEVVKALVSTGMLEEDAVFAVQAALILNKDEEEGKK